ncbi:MULTISPECIES: aldo/keto reductase [unclassified Modestobacter]
MHQRRIGDRTVSAVGLGAMPLSSKDDRPSPADAEAVVHAALDAGVTLIDTADAYAHDEAEFGHNEELVARALRSHRGSTGDVLVATKGGHTRRGSDWDLDGRPEYLRRACEASLRRLGVEAIGLYQFHRPDPATPWEDSMGALRSLVDDGLVHLVGVSNADVAQIDTARQVIGPAFVSVQNQFSPGWRSSAGELAHCAELGLAFLPWSPFGGVSSAKSLGSTAGAFATVADELGVSVYQVTLAWHLAQADVVVPIPGASRAASITDSAAAADLRLTPEQLARLDAA